MNKKSRPSGGSFLFLKNLAPKTYFGRYPLDRDCLSYKAQNIFVTKMYE